MDWMVGFFVVVVIPFANGILVYTFAKLKVVLHCVADAVLLFNTIETRKEKKIGASFIPFYRWIMTFVLNILLKEIFRKKKS